MENFKSIYDYINQLPVFSDHEHHRPDSFYENEMTLSFLLKSSYVSWATDIPDIDDIERSEFLDNIKYNSYFTWFEKGLQRVHGINDPITAENWEDISVIVKNKYKKDTDFHWKALMENGYERLVQDSYWNPGDDNGHDIFIPTFRIDKFMYGYHKDSVAPDDFFPWERYGFNGGSLNDYVDLMKEIIVNQYNKGKVVAFKSAEAYRRPLALLPDDKKEAEAVFGLHPSQATEEQKRIFGNYIFNRCCELAAEIDVPFQIHTGLALLSGSQPMKLEPLIAKHQKTRFVLFHSGFPWTHEVSGLAHNYRNVLPSLTWTATICTSAAVRALQDYIDVAASVNNITWGSDCWTPEESVGAQLAWRFIVAKALAERLDDGRMTSKTAELLSEKLMFANGRKVYNCYKKGEVLSCDQAR